MIKFTEHQHQTRPPRDRDGRRQIKTARLAMAERRQDMNIVRSMKMTTLLSRLYPCPVKMRFIQIIYSHFLRASRPKKSRTSLAFPTTICISPSSRPLTERPLASLAAGRDEPCLFGCRLFLGPQGVGGGNTVNNSIARFQSCVLPFFHGISQKAGYST